MHGRLLLLLLGQVGGGLEKVEAANPFKKAPHRAKALAITRKKPKKRYTDKGSFADFCLGSIHLVTDFS